MSGDPRLWGILDGSNVDLRLEKHPEKTFIGRIERGFDFLGYHFSPKGLTAARKTLKRFVSRATRLYEQKPWSCKTFRHLPGIN